MSVVNLFDPRPQYWKWRMDDDVTFYMKVKGFKLYKMRLYDKGTSLASFVPDNGEWKKETILDTFFFKFIYPWAVYLTPYKYHKDMTFYNRIKESEVFIDVL